MADSILSLPRDLQAFILHIQQQREVQDGLFDARSPIHVARAPGRLDVMGGIADYSGATVLEWPIQEATLAAAQSCPGQNDIRMVTRDLHGNVRECTVPLSVLQPGGAPAEYESVQAYFAANTADRWGAYIAGPLLALLHQKGLTLQEGLTIYLETSVPEAVGVSSSAAVEIASLKAVVSLLGLSIGGTDLARIAQHGENHVVGAPCGIMDQLTCGLGEEGRLLMIRCQPSKVEGTLALPPEIALWAMDSGERHEVSGAAYSTVRTAAFMGYRILAELSELSWRFASGGHYVYIDDVRWHGYLANVSPLAYEAEFSRSLPGAMEGRAFLERYRGSSDPITRIDPASSYPVRAAAEFPIYENARVKRFRSLIASCSTEEELMKLGSIMLASHESYKSCGLGSPGTERLVELVIEAGSASGLHGARITGGGSGGAVAIIGRNTARAQDTIAGIAETFRAETGHAPHIFSGSSPGAEAVGAHRIDPMG